MWRHYYEKRLIRLRFDLYAAIREQYGLSPANAYLVSRDLARAAQIFQESHGRAAAENAIPLLERAYHRLARATGESFDAHRAATLELDWWQQRREHVSPETYAQTIAALALVVYSAADDPRIHAAAFERAKAMAFRDSLRKTGLTEHDWAKVLTGLKKSYRLFHEALVIDKGEAPKFP
jgi:hypothetical protein